MNDRLSPPPEPRIIAKFDAKLVDDFALEKLQKYALLKVMGISPHLGEWLGGWCQAELTHRRENTARSEAHELCLPAYAFWPNADLGYAIRAVTALSYCSLKEPAAKLVDRQVMGLVEAVASRLISARAKS